MRVVKYLVDYVTQFPSDTECTRYIATISDKVVYNCVLCCVSLKWLWVTKTFLTTKIHKCSLCTLLGGHTNDVLFFKRPIQCFLQHCDVYKHFVVFMCWKNKCDLFCCTCVSIGNALYPTFQWLHYAELLSRTIWIKKIVQSLSNKDQHYNKGYPFVWKKKPQ